MKVQIHTLSKNKLILKLTEHSVKNSDLEKALDKTRQHCFVEVQRIWNDLMILFQSDDRNRDLFITASLFLEDLKQVN